MEDNQKWLVHNEVLTAKRICAHFVDQTNALFPTKLPRPLGEGKSPSLGNINKTK